MKNILKMLVIPIFLSGCVTDKIYLGDIPGAYDSKVYIKSVDLPRGPGDPLYVPPRPGQPLRIFSPSLVKYLDYKLGAVLDPSVDSSSIHVIQFSINWVSPGDSSAWLFAGALGGGALGVLAADMAYASLGSGRQEQLVCYFRGEYKNQSFELEKVEACPLNSKHCFRSSAKEFDTSVPATRMLVEKLAGQCINKVVETVGELKKSASRDVTS